MSSRVTKLFVVSAVLIAILMAPQAAQAAAPELPFALLGTHPQAATQATSSGKYISSMKIWNGKLYMAYGDYYSNTGPVSVNPFDLNSGSFDGVAITMPSEALSQWKVINNKIYSASVDPTCGGTCQSSYVVGDANGNWQLKTPFNAEHVFGITTYNGTDLWLFGATGGPTATLWRSTNDGASWTVMQTSENEPGGDNTERYYWAETLNGTLYAQAHFYDINPIQSFNGSTWSTGTIDRTCGYGGPGGGPNTEVFAGKIICDDNLKTNVFDGTAAVPLNLPSRYCYSADDSSWYNTIFSVSDDKEYFYMVCDAHQAGSGSNTYSVPAQIVRTKDLVTWQPVGSISNAIAPSSIVIKDNTIYLGTQDAKLYSATFDPDELPLASPTVDLISPDNAAINLTVAGCDELTNTSVVEESSLESQDANYDYPFGLTRFRLGSCEVNSASRVTITFEGLYDPSAVTIRKYDELTSDSAKYTTLTQANSGLVVTPTVLGGTPVLQVSYNLIDGGALDADGQFNGTIIDPIGLAVSPQGSVSSENPQSNQTALGLAPTGIAATGLLFLGASLSVAGTLIYIRIKASPMR